MNKTLLFIGALCSAIALFTGGYVLTHPHRATLQEMQKSTVSLKMTLGTCSGWVLKDHQMVVTAAHCVADSPNDPVAVDFHDGTGAHQFKVYKMGDIEGPKPDLAILVPVDGHKINWPKGLPICHFKPYYLEPLIFFGDPLGLPEAVTIGRISNPSQVVGQIRGTPYIQYDGSLTPGMSGGAAVDAKEQCVMGSGEATIQTEGDAVRFLEQAVRLSEVM